MEVAVSAAHRRPPGAADTLSREVKAGTWPRSRVGVLDWLDDWGIYPRWL